MRLGGLANSMAGPTQRSGDECLRTALAICAPDQDPRQVDVWITEAA